MYLRWRVLSVLAAVLVGATVLPPRANAAPVESVAAVEGTCECVDYIQNRFGLTGRMPDAWQMGSVLRRNGFRQVREPQLGVVVVFQRGVAGASSHYGHVAVITGFTRTSNGMYVVGIAGANQPVPTGGVYATDARCTNVTNVTVEYPVHARGVAYYVR